MNQEQVLSIVRSVLSILGTVLVTRGLVGDTDWTTISGAVLMLTPVVWSMFVHSTSAKLNAAVNDPKAVEVAKTIAPTPQVIAVADALKAAP